MPNPFVDYTEALATATSNLDVHNARALIDWVDNAPGAAEQQAAMWITSARRINEKILVAGEFADALHDFAATQARQAERIREVGTIFRRAHAEELRRINEPKPGEDKWDISKNDLAGSTPSKIAPASAAEEAPVSSATPSGLPCGELTVIKALSPGKRAVVDLVQDAYGRVAIRKTFHPDPDDRIRADREVAAAAVANAVGITDLEVRRVDDDTVLMTYFEGKTGAELAYATMSPEDVALLDDDAATDEQVEDPEWLARWSKADDEYRANLEPWMRAPGAKEIGLIDYLALNIDRNSSNWIVGDDGVVHPIDHDASFIGAIQQVRDGLVDFDSPFMKAWLAKDDVGGHRRPDALVSPFSRSHLEQVMERLEDAKPALDRIPPVRGVGTYDLVRQRLEWLIEACDATT
ncbi:hypothetical protein [Saccharothrix obliqua]|uniref:hypothetical protein n=1 Tax=Saccharothrix obliqua TaxID=2861747 RepID=UPI001C5F342F|nr:hypothetical protein [Saccharothrix obliqua]MBW4722441.1 hypothetical protein [Saccharothrix obliqua]